MLVVVAPDSFKGSLAAAGAADALAEGVGRARPDARIDRCPVADGGEGTVDAILAAAGGERREARVRDPLGREIRARFGLLPPRDGRRVAVLEMAVASGLPLLSGAERDAERTTTHGTGDLILAALDAGADEILLGIGGSATVDGGRGCIEALGGPDGLDARLRETRIRVACDVTNPLLGPEGAAAVYGPQKGATPEAVERLERRLAEWARRLGGEGVDRPGAGAAGGLGFGLAAVCGATLTPGFALVAEAIGLGRRLEGAALCLTGEGRLDAQSAAGKAAAGVARLARERGVPVVCVPGRTAADAPRDLFDRVLPLEDDDPARTRELLARRAEEATASLS